MGSKIDEGYTEFGSSTAPGWLRPSGLLGRFFAKFFASKAGPTIARDDPNSKSVPPDLGDAVVNPEVITAGPNIGSQSSPFPQVTKNELSKKERYKAFEDMDNFPEIGAAFDIYSDECSQKGTNGERWTVESKSTVVQEEVYNLFSRIRLEDFYWDLIRNTVKYGDCYAELIVDLNNARKGIQKLKILNPGYIVRTENEFGYLEGFFQEIPSKGDWSSYGAYAQAYESKKYLPLDKEQVVHFRLHTSDPEYYPYGKSIAAMARSVFRSLQLMEDAMLIYRLERAPERWIFYINVGAMPPAKVSTYIEDLKQKFKKEKYYNRDTGQIDAKYNPINASENFYVPVRNGNDGTKIETLKGAENLGDIDDVKYFRDKLLALLKIPKDFIVEKDKSPERKANLSQLDVKFARTVARVQQCIELGLESIAKRHLQLKGFPESTFSDLRVRLPEPSDMAIKRKLDVEEQKARVIAAVQATNLFSKPHIYKSFYGMTSEQIESLELEIQKDLAMETQGVMPATFQQGGGMMMEEGMEGGDGEAASEDTRYESGADSRENDSPTTVKESMKLVMANKKLSPEAKRIIIEGLNISLLREIEKKSSKEGDI